MPEQLARPVSAWQSIDVVPPRDPRLDVAFERLADIHAQVARSSHFVGYRAIPVACMGALAVVAAALESSLVPAGSAQLHAGYWLVVAVTCASAGALDLFLRRRSLSGPGTWSAVLQLVPALVSGAVMGFVLKEQAELLPGVWTTLFGLGVLASRPYLASAIHCVALFYVAAGLAMTLASRDGLVPSAWAMGLTFGVGQFVSAAALRRTAVPPLLYREEDPE